MQKFGTESMKFDGNEPTIISAIPQLASLTNTTLEIAGVSFLTDMEVKVTEIDKTVKMEIQYGEATFTIKGNKK